MLVHTVVFWGKPNLSAADKAAFRQGIESLRQIPVVEIAYIGTPAGVPDRPVVDKSYAFCLTAVFKDVAAHNTYQTHPVHLEFIEKNKQYWERVQIYDAE